MKVSLNHTFQCLKQPAFKGSELRKDEFGDEYYEWSFPFDAKKYNCYLDVYPVVADKNGNYDSNDFKKKYIDITTGADCVKLEPAGNKVYLDYIFGKVHDAPFAYRYRLQPIDNPNAPAIVRVDAGDIVDKRDFVTNSDGVYNIVIPKLKQSAMAGSAVLISADNFDVAWKYGKDGKIERNPNAQKGYDTFKNFSNHVGGSLAGVHKALREGRLDPYDRIFYLPHTSGDRTSAVGYWLESGFQLSSAGDNIDNFTKFQNELFAKSKTIVMDSALTSEGVSGIHIQSILQHGPEDVFFDWFKAAPLKNMSAKIGAFGAKTQFIRHKLVNAPKNPVQDANGYISWETNPAYDKKSPTFVQVYNIDQASAEQVNNPNLFIDRYDYPNGSNPMRYGNHNDTVITYAFPINFKTYENNIKRLEELNKSLIRQHKPFVPVNSYEGTRILTKFEGFEFENKIDGGFYTWDANVDLIKFDYAQSVEDIEEAMNLPLDERKKFYYTKRQKRAEVLDYAVSSLKYWTGKTNQELNLYVAQTLRGMDTKDADKAYDFLQKQIKDGNLPRKMNNSYNNPVTREVVYNVLNDDYLLKGAKSLDNFHDTILGGLMSYPLESTEVGKDILALFSTPFITNRATQLKQVGLSRIDLLKQGNPHLTPQYEDVYNTTTRMYSGEMYNFARSVIDEVNDKLPQSSKLNKGGDTSDYGKYVLPIITQEIAKFAVVKGLFPDIESHINKDRGGITYDYESMRKKSLKGLHIYPTSQENEAEDLILKMKSGIKNISAKDRKQLVDAVYKMIEGTNLKDFQMAEMIVDRTKSGMDLRVDAVKDFSNMDGLRNGADRFDDNWNEVIRILNAIGEGTRKVNPNIYIVPEVTDEVDLYKLGEGDLSERFNWKKGFYDGKYLYKDDIIMKLLRETGADAVANYQKLFTNIESIHGKRADDGLDWGENQDSRMFDVFRRAPFEDLADESKRWANESAEEFLYTLPYDAVNKSYTFVDNHDKPRINHVLSLDMELFYANLNNNYTPKEKEFRRRAYEVLNPDKSKWNEYTVENYDFSYVSPMAVARGESLNKAFEVSVNNIAGSKDEHGRELINPAQKDSIIFGLKNVVAELASGRYRGINFEPDNFGVEDIYKLINMVVKEYAENNYGAFSDEAIDALVQETYKDMIDTAMNNSLGMDKYLINSPGIPTMYAGDETGATGYERKTKNDKQKNRSANRPDFADKYPFIKTRRDQKEAIYTLRLRPALHALNDGAPYLLKLQNSEQGKKVVGLLRYAPDGSAVISLMNTAGISHDYRRKTDPYNNSIRLAGNRIDLSNEGKNGLIGLHGGINTDMVFYNAYDPNDKYYVFNAGGDDNYYLAKDVNCNTPIVMTDNVLTLYSAPAELLKEDKEFLDRVQAAKLNKTSFCGKLYEKQTYNVAPVSYKQTSPAKLGTKLELISK